MSNISCILYPPTLDYRYLVQRPQQLMKSFSELNVPVYYLNNASPHLPAVHGLEKPNPNFYLFNNVNPEPFLQGIQPVVYYSATAQVDSIKQYNPSLVVFDSVDEPSDEFEAWRPFYNRAVSMADVVLTTSQKLYNMASALNPYTYLIPNGCDFSYFSQASTKSLPVPEDMAGIDGPIIGYVGVIATWCDLNLIDRLALSFPHCNIVMVGPLYNITDVPRRPNIHWLGFKAYEQLASYVQLFDVGIIPFKKTSMIESVNPIKMWEYMAAGIPIVTTDIPEAHKYQDLVLCSENADIFIQNISHALDSDSPEKREQRVTLAGQNSWLSRAQQIIDIIEDRLQERGGISKQKPVGFDDGFIEQISLPEDEEVHFYYVNRLTPFRKLTVCRRNFRYSIRYGGRGHVYAYADSVRKRAVQGYPHRFLSVGKTCFRYRTERCRFLAAQR